MDVIISMPPGDAEDVGEKSGPSPRARISVMMIVK